jgi:hypothetical protein
MNIPSLSKKLTLKDGIWFSPESQSLSYPEDANDLYFEIEDKSFWFNHRNKCITALIDRFAPHKTFHDIGGGNGAVSVAVQSAGKQSVLIEPGIKGCANAKKRGIVNVVCSTFQNALDSEHKAELVGMFDVLEHIENENEFLRELGSRMTDNGVLIMTVPAFNWLWSEEDSQVGHFRRYTMSSAKDILLRAGFSPVYCSYLFSFLPLPIFLFRSIPSKLSRKRKYNDATTISKEHGSGKTPFALQVILNWELGRVIRGAALPIGSSCILVARKNP